MRTFLLATLLLALSGCASGQTQVFSATNLDDTLTNWHQCFHPSCEPGGIGTPTSVGQTINNASPAKDGASMLLSMNGPAFTNVLWYYESGAHNTAVQLQADFQAYVTGTTINNIEFDTYQYLHTSLGLFMYGSQCHIGGFWQVWDSLNGAWINTTLPCVFSTGAWHHVQWIVHRITGDTSCSGHPCMYYDDLIIDGADHVIGMLEPAGVLPGNFADQTGLNFQLDSNGSGGALTMNIDQVSIKGYDSTGSFAMGGSGDIGQSTWGGGGTCGPPLYLCASLLTTDPGVIAPLFVSTASPVTTCSGDCQNTVKEDLTIPGHLVGTEKITRVTSGATIPGGQPYSITISAGDNDHMWSYPNGTYLWITENGGIVQPFQISTSTGYAQVVNAGCIPPELNPGGAFGTGWLQETNYYYFGTGTGKSQLHHGHLTGSGCSIALNDDGILVDLLAPGVCPGNPSFTVGWKGILGISKDDDSFGISMGPSGQGNADWNFVWSKTKGCSTVNFNSGQVWAFCTVNCATAPALGTLPSTGCWGSSGSTGKGIHNSQMSGDGIWIRVSVTGPWTQGACAGSAISEQTSLLKIGTLNDTWQHASSSTDATSAYANHPSEGISKSLTGDFYNGPNIRSLATPNTYTQFANRPNTGDIHCSWPHNNNGVYDDSLWWICATDNNSSASSTTNPKYFENAIVGMDPNAAYPGKLVVFAHTFGCNDGAAGHALCPDGTGEGYFQAQDSIGIVSPKGDMFAWSTSMLHSLGKDNAGKFRPDVFIVMLQ